SGKDEVLVPIVSDSFGELVDRIAAQPVDEPLSVAVERAVEAFQPRLGDEGVAALAQLLGAVPALSARVGLEFAALEERMVALVRPTRTVASRELFGVLADAQRVTLVSAPAGRTPRSVRTAHASLISDIRDLLSGRTPPAPQEKRSHSWSHSQKASSACCTTC